MGKSLINLWIMEWTQYRPIDYFSNQSIPIPLLKLIYELFCGLWLVSFKSLSLRQEEYFIRPSHICLFICFSITIHKVEFIFNTAIKYICEGIKNLLSPKPYKKGGAFKAPPEQNWRFKHLLVIQLSQKNLTFPTTLWGCLSYPFGGLKQPKKGFL